MKLATGRGGLILKHLPNVLLAIVVLATLVWAVFAGLALATLWAGDGGRPDDYTETCSLHIANLMTDAYVHHIHPIETTGAARD